MSARPNTSATWRDWAWSGGLHATLLGAVLISATWSRTNHPVTQTLDVDIHWAAEPAPAPLPHSEPAAPVPQALPTEPSRGPTRQATPTPTVSPQPTTEPSDKAMPSASTAPESATASAYTAAPSPDAAAAPATRSPSATHAAPEVVTADPAAERRWQAQLEALLARDKHYPMSARRARQEGVVLVEAHFSADGQLLRSAVHTASGFSVLDEAALAMVKRAADVTRAQLTPGRPAQLRIPITFHLEET